MKNIGMVIFNAFHKLRNFYFSNMLTYRADKKLKIKIQNMSNFFRYIKF